MVDAVSSTIQKEEFGSDPGNNIEKEGKGPSSSSSYLVVFDRDRLPLTNSLCKVLCLSLHPILLVCSDDMSWCTWVRNTMGQQMKEINRR